MTTETDHIREQILIAAPVERVWSILTEGQFLGSWFGNGEPAQVDLRPGGMIIFDHGVHGALPARIEKVDRPCQLSYRWSQGDAGTEPTDSNATLVVFTLDSVAEGTVLRVVESGFDSLSDLSAENVQERRGANEQNWPGKLDFMRSYVEQLMG